ncbi:MAG: alanine--glyoxylate aminotransferase family protein [Promethearchaeati archaeon SRVP18_Atabeyarchaeia-1]
MGKELLMIPGPTPVSDKVLRAMASQIISHASDEFTKALEETAKMTAEVFQTKGQPLVLAGSGTLGMEAAVANVVERGERILCVNNGFFGPRFAEIAKAHGVGVDTVEFEWGRHADPSIIREKLEKGNYKALTIVHVDTGTGVANPIREVGEFMRDLDALYIVDTVCSMGGMNVQVDKWNIDVCLTGSQKAIAAPPGLTLLSFSEKAQKCIDRRKSPVETYYMDFTRWKSVMQDPKSRSYFATPSVPLVMALREALTLVTKEGLERRWLRHQAIAEAARAGLEAMELHVFPEENFRANTLSVFNVPEGISDVDLRNTLEKTYRIVIAGGLGQLKGKTLRIGHMGIVTPNNILATLNSIGLSLNKLGRKSDSKKAVMAARTRLRSAWVEG